MHLYRVVSTAEYNNLKATDAFHTAINTLEGKQFFKSELAVRAFAAVATQRGYRPPYRYIIVIQIEEAMLQLLNYDDIPLDGYEAITIPEDDLEAFNNSITFISRNVI